MNHALREAYNRVRKDLAEQRGGTLSFFDDKVSEVVFRAAELAIRDRALNDTKRRPTFRVVSAPTGSGKTSCTMAFIAAMLESDPAFTAAIIMETCLSCDDVYRDLVSIVGPEEVSVWSKNAHDVSADELLERKTLNGQQAAVKTRREDLLRSRVAICTHSAWEAEMKCTQKSEVKSRRGARHYSPSGDKETAQRRTVLFVDEKPSLTRIYEVQSRHVADLKDALRDGGNSLRQVSLLSKIYARMEKAANAPQSYTYVPVTLVTPEEAARFEHFTKEDARLLAPRSEDRAEAFQELVGFFKTAALGNVFMSQQGIGGKVSFVAYEIAYDNTDPGIVLLDATADLDSYCVLSKDFAKIDCPKARYDNLFVVSVLPPDLFARGTYFIDKRGAWADYGQWVHKLVMENTDPGERVLVIAHKELVNQSQGLWKTPYDTPRNMDGRLVSCITWGSGIGLNKWKDCQKVFAIGEFIAPRSADIAETHAQLRLKAELEELAKAQGQKFTGNYLLAQEGRRLRWQVQLALRGSARVLDEAGEAGKMTLFTTMEPEFLDKHFRRMFPGADVPLVLDLSDKEPGSQALRLTKLLRTSDEDILTSETVQELAGVKKLREVLQESEAVQIAMDLYGWRAVRPKEVGIKGRALILAREEALNCRTSPRQCSRGTSTLREAA